MAYHPDGNHHPPLVETCCLEAEPELLGYESLIYSLRMFAPFFLRRATIEIGIRLLGESLQIVSPDLSRLLRSKRVA